MLATLALAIALQGFDHRGLHYSVEPSGFVASIDSRCDGKPCGGRFPVTFETWVRSMFDARMGDDERLGA